MNPSPLAFISSNFACNSSKAFEPTELSKCCIASVLCEQWRRQRSKGARSFQGLNILELGHPDALFSSKKLTTFFSYCPQNTKAANATDIVLLSK